MLHIVASEIVEGEFLFKRYREPLTFDIDHSSRDCNAKISGRRLEKTDLMLEINIFLVSILTDNTSIVTATETRNTAITQTAFPRVTQVFISEFFSLSKFRMCFLFLRLKILAYTIRV